MCDSPGGAPGRHSLLGLGWVASETAWGAVASPRPWRVGLATRGSRRTIRTPKIRVAILDALTLTRGWSVHGAYRQAGIGYQSYYDWRREDADAAMEAATDHLEDVARDRAIQHSDLLPNFLLRARRQHIYNQKQIIAVGGDPDAPPISVDVDEQVHFFMPSNKRDRPEELEADAQRTIEGEADEDAA